MQDSKAFLNGNISEDFQQMGQGVFGIMNIDR